MKIKFSIGTEGGALYIQREEGDKPAKASGYSRGVHGWGAEIHLLGMICKVLNQHGFGLIRKRLAGDEDYCHLLGDDHMNYVRTAKGRKKDSPHLWFVDGNYAVRSSAKEYNQYEEVRFEMQGDIFQMADGPPIQPDWYERVEDLCDKAGIECNYHGESQ